MTPFLSIVIVNWNGSADLERCLGVLHAQCDASAEIIVVDNASTDDSIAAACRTHPAVIVLRQGRNIGFAAGCNAGIEHAQGEWLLTLNNDTIPSADFVSLMTAAARAAAPQIGMLQPRLRLLGQQRLNSTGVLVHRDGSANDRDFDAPLETRREPDEVLCPTAGAGCYRREMLDELRLKSGWFDPSYFMYFEDVDLGWRCRLAGWEARYLPDPIVDHVFQGSSQRHGRHFVTTHCMRNRVRTLLKNGSWRMIGRSLPRTASDLLWLMQHAGGRALSTWLEALRDGLRQRGEVAQRLRQKRRTLERRWMRTEPGATTEVQIAGSSVQG